MESLLLDKTEDTPHLSFAADSGVFEMAGRSLPEDAYSFYRPVNEWLEKFVLNSGRGNVIVKIHLDYFNSSSGRYLLEMFAIMQNSKSVEFSIQWYADADDELMIEKGEELKSLVRVPFEVVHP